MGVPRFGGLQVQGAVVLARNVEAAMAVPRFRGLQDAKSSTQAMVLVWLYGPFLHSGDCKWVDPRELAW